MQRQIAPVRETQQRWEPKQPQLPHIGRRVRLEVDRAGARIDQARHATGDPQLVPVRVAVQPGTDVAAVVSQVPLEQRGIVRRRRQLPVDVHIQRLHPTTPPQESEGLRRADLKAVGRAGDTHHWLRNA